MSGSWRPLKNSAPTLFVVLQPMTGYLDELFPGFRDHIPQIETATPRTLERYGLNQNGPVYGWTQRVSNVRV